MGWKAFQLSVLVAFLFANVFFEWGIEGIAAPVMGGMLAYYLTKVILAIRGELAPLQQPADPGEAPGSRLPDWRAEKRIELARKSEQRPGLPLQGPRQR